MSLVHMATVLTAMSPAAELTWTTVTKVDVTQQLVDVHKHVASETRSGAQSWVGDFRRSIAPLMKLRAGWDGPGSTEVSRAAIYRAEHLLGLALAGATAPVLPAVVPTSDGRVQLEWHRSNLELEVLIDEDGQITALVEDHERGLEIEKAGDEGLALFLRWAPRAAQADSHVPDVAVSPAKEAFSLAA